MNDIEVVHECTACGGTGLYSGMAESNELAVVCHRCRGTGSMTSRFHPFTGRKPMPGIRRVLQANPGIKAGAGSGYVLEDFGGLPIEDWFPGRVFPVGTEMRRFSCPRWWNQCVGRPMNEWTECCNNLGRSFSQCIHFPMKSKCWTRWDHERDASTEPK